MAINPSTQKPYEEATKTVSFGGWGAIPNYGGGVGSAPAPAAPAPNPAPAPAPASNVSSKFVIGGSNKGTTGTTSTTGTTTSTAPIFTGANVTAPAALTLDPNAYVSNQLTNILAKDSPTLQLARTRAAQQANARGLFNSSIGAEAGEVAAIQTALPIAQQDAQTVGQVGQFNTEQTNLFNREQNNFQREAALKTSDQTFQANQETVNFARQLEQMGYQSKLTQSQLPQQFIAGVSQQAQAGVQAILADPNLKPDAKQNAIKNLVDYSNATLSWAEKFYGIATPDLPGGNASTNTAAPGVVP